MNLSSLSKTCFIAVLQLVLMATLVVAPRLLAPHMVIMGAVLLITGLAQLYYLWRIRAKFFEIARVCEQSAAGNFEPRIVTQRESGNLLNGLYSINRLIDIADAYVRESRAAMEHAAEGKYFRRIVYTGLQGTYQHSAKAINEGMQAIRRNIAQSMEQAAHSMLEVADTGVTQAEELTESASAASQNVGTIAAAVEELSASIAGINRNLEDTRCLVENATAKSTHAGVVLADLIRAEEQIVEIVNFIQGIASQINMLSLNATIEASRAGDAGKGFAVVAAEVKALATQTADAALRVTQSIRKTREEIDKTATAVGDIQELMQGVNLSATAVSAAMSQQTEAVTEVARTIQHTAANAEKIAEAARHVSETSYQTGEAARSIYRSVESLVGKTGEAA